MALGAVLLVARAAFAARFDLFPDEMLYAWLWNYEPLNFCPHPPGTPLLAGLGMELAGRTGLGVRLLSLVIGCLTPVAVYYLGRALAGRAVACWSALFFLALPITFAFGAILTPDGTQMFLWALAMLFTWHALEGSGRRATLAWVAAGATVGIGLHVKYMMILYFPSLALCILTTPRWRMLWRAKGPWLCVIIAAVVFGPLAAFTEYKEGWPTLQYHLVSRQSGVSPSWENVFIYHGGHLAMYSPLLYPAMVVALFAALWRGLRGARRELIFVGWFGAFMWLFFAIISAATVRRLDREQWDAPVYIAGVVALAMVANYWLVAARGPVSRRRRMTLTAAAPLIGLLIIGFGSVEIFSGAFTTAIGRRPLFSSIIGWREMTARADAEFDRLPAETPALLLSNRFSGVFAYWFYGEGNHPAFTFDDESADRYGVSFLLKKHGISADHLLPKHLGDNAVVMDVGRNKPANMKRLKLGLSPWFDSFPLPIDGGVVKRGFVISALGFRDARTTDTLQN